MTSTIAPRVGVFDSGVGGLSVLASLRAQLAHCQFHYLCDNLNFPYGIKTDDEVVRFTYDATSRFVARFGLDLLVIACNTASTIALPRLRSSFKVPVVGVVPAIKPAAGMSVAQTIALLATPATVRRPYTDELIEKFAADCRVIRTGSSALVSMAERKLRGEVLALDEVRREIEPMFAASPQAAAQRLDVVVLGCTHFPLLRDELVRAAPWPVRWIDSGDAIAARTAHLLKEHGRPLEGPAAGPMTFLSTRRDDGTKALEPALRNLHFGEFLQL